MLFELKNALTKHAQNGLMRERQVRNSPVDPHVFIAKKPFLNFASNDYLGLANHPKVMEAFKSGADGYGVGSGASQAVSGYTTAHQALEEALAEFLGYPRVLLFSTGYMANIGVLTALSPHLDLILQDKLCHASLVDGAIFSKARFERYLHSSIKDLTKRLEKYSDKRCLVASDGVFSVQGDIAPLVELSKTTHERSQFLMIDDAHSIGVLGRHGRGTLEHFQCDTSAVDILVGTFGKAFGTFGAFVAADSVIIETLIQYARSYMYTTALPPAIAVATTKSLSLIQSEPWRREKLSELIAYFQKGLTDLGMGYAPSITPIQSIEVGSAERAFQMGKQLAEQGIVVAVMRPPTTPPHRSCLRVTITSLHEKEHLDQLFLALKKTYATS